MTTLCTLVGDYVCGNIYYFFFFFALEYPNSPVSSGSLSPLFGRSSFCVVSTGHGFLGLLPTLTFLLGAMFFLIMVEAGGGEERKVSLQGELSSGLTVGNELSVDVGLCF